MALEDIPLPPAAPAAAGAAPPADEAAERVRTLAGLGVPDVDIAAALGITEAELTRLHGRAIAQARAMARATVAQAVFRRATQGTGRDADNAAREFFALTGGRLGIEPPRAAETPAAPAPAATPAGLTCNFEEMAEKLGISKPTLREWIARYDDFPVLARGSNGVAWRFDPAEVIAFVARRREEDAAADQQRMDLLGQMPLPFEAQPGAAPAVDFAEMRQLYRIAREADELALSRKALLRVADVREPLAEMIARLRSSALSLPRRWGARHNLPGPVVAELKRDMEEWLTEMHAGFRQHLTAAAVPDMEPTPDDEAPAAAA